MTQKRLFPTFEAPVITTQIQSQAALPDFKSAPGWNTDAGDFMVDGSGRIVNVNGWQAWYDWCVKALQTERFSSILYPASYGAELEQVIGGDLIPAQVELIMAKTITECLTADPRTSRVYNFSFHPLGNQLEAGFWVEPVKGIPAQFFVVVNR